MEWRCICVPTLYIHEYSLYIYNTRFVRFSQSLSQLGKSHIIFTFCYPVSRCQFRLLIVVTKCSLILITISHECVLLGIFWFTVEKTLSSIQLGFINKCCAERYRFKPLLLPNIFYQYFYLLRTVSVALFFCQLVLHTGY